MLLKANTSYTYSTFGFTLQYDYRLKRDFVNTIKTKYPDSKIFPNPRYTYNKLRGVLVTSIHSTRVFTSDDTLKHLCVLHDQGVLEFSLTFAREINYHSKRLANQPTCMAYSTLILDGTRTLIWPKSDPLQ